MAKGQKCRVFVGRCFSIKRHWSTPWCGLIATGNNLLSARVENPVALCPRCSCVDLAVCLLVCACGYSRRYANRLVSGGRSLFKKKIKISLARGNAQECRNAKKQCAQIFFPRRESGQKSWPRSATDSAWGSIANGIWDVPDMWPYTWRFGESVWQVCPETSQFTQTSRFPDSSPWAGISCCQRSA